MMVGSVATARGHSSCPALVLGNSARGGGVRWAGVTVLAHDGRDGPTTCLLSVRAAVGTSDAPSGWRISTLAGRRSGCRLTERGHPGALEDGSVHLLWPRDTDHRRPVAKVSQAKALKWAPSSQTMAGVGRLEMAGRRRYYSYSAYADEISGASYPSAGVYDFDLQSQQQTLGS
jgi:hypothetical protein